MFRAKYLTRRKEENRKQRGQKERDKAIEAVLAHDEHRLLISVSDCDAITAEYLELLKLIFINKIGRVLMHELAFLKPLSIDRISSLCP